jgi:hypothetical protein
MEILCSSRKRLRNDDKYSVQLQSTSQISIRVPKTPRCIDRLESVFYSTGWPGPSGD